MNSFFHIFLFISLLILEVLYLKLATFSNIVDKPNHRSLHTKNTVRGGGIIFGVSYLIYSIFNNFPYFYFFIGFNLIAIISFVDDIVTLSNKSRLPFQFLAICLMLYQIHIELYSFYWFIPFAIFGVSILNAYNFMDGINGINGAYSLIILLSLYYINSFIHIFIENDFLLSVIISILVFLIFNFRKKAICFGGDVGSISIGFLILFFISKLIIDSSNGKYLFFLFLYGIDTIYTIIYRLQLRQNIFDAHKLHLYQLMVYKQNISHLKVASLYAIIQLLLNLWIIQYELNSIFFYIPFIFFLLFVHILRVKLNSAITIK